MTSTVVLLSLLASSGKVTQVSDETVAADAAQWHQQRLARLTAPDGWLTLVGLHWLEQGDSVIGSDPAAAVRLPAGAPARVGVLTRKGMEVSLRVEPGVEVTYDGVRFEGGPFRSHAKGTPDVLAVGQVTFQVIERGERVGIRVKDAGATARAGFPGIERYPARSAWRVEARLVRSKAPRTIAIPTVLNTIEQMPSPGTLVFTLQGREHRLDPVLEEGSDQLFILFGDQTNRDATYGAGRFLYATLEGDRAVLDFNRAYNPPCAFSPYATCPLPPRQNKLKVRIEAGEKRYAARR